MSHPAWTVARLAGMLTGEQDRLAQIGAGDLQVRAAFEVSYAQLTQEDARLFRLLGLHPGPNYDVLEAVTYADLRRFEQAVACFEQALAINRETGDRCG